MLVFALCSCTNAISQSVSISDFESCVAAGNRVLRSYPAKCVAPGIGTFTQSSKIKDTQSEESSAPSLRYDQSCKNLCGDGECAEVVCQSVGCPCPENEHSCPSDCKESTLN